MAFRTDYATTVKQQGMASVKRQTAAPVRDMSSRASLWAATAACLISLWICAGIRLVTASVASTVTSSLLRTANYLLAGQWLGPYDTMTISKGMFDPLFLFVVSAVSTPVKIAERLAYLSPADPL